MPRSARRVSEASVDLGSVDLGLEADRVEHPFVQGPDRQGPVGTDQVGHHHGRPARDVVLGKRGGRPDEHHVRRHVTFLEVGRGPGSVVDDQPADGDRRRPDGLPAELPDHVGRSDGLLEAGHEQVAVAHGLGAERLERRPLRARHQPERGRCRRDPDRDDRRAHGVRQHRCPQRRPGPRRRPARGRTCPSAPAPAAHELRPARLDRRRSRRDEDQSVAVLVQERRDGIREIRHRPQPALGRRTGRRTSGRSARGSQVSAT